MSKKSKTATVKFRFAVFLLPWQEIDPNEEVDLDEVWGLNPPTLPESFPVSAGHLKIAVSPNADAYFEKVYPYGDIQDKSPFDSDYPLSPFYVDMESKILLDDSFEKLDEHASKQSDILRCALQLFQAGEVRIMPWWVAGTDFGNLDVERPDKIEQRFMDEVRSATMLRESGFPPFGFEPLRIDSLRPYPLDQGKVIALATFLKSSLESIQKIQESDIGLALALRRFDWSLWRSRPEDKLVDLMIALEALFLADGEGKDGGIANKLALRSAGWNYPPTEARVKQYEAMKRLYSVRGRVVHGSKKYNQDDLQEKVRLLEDYVRLSLQKLLAVFKERGRIPEGEEFDRSILFSTRLDEGNP